MFDISFLLGSCDNRNGTLFPVIVFVLGFGSSALTACLKRCRSLLDRASADTANLFEIAAILIECSLEMCTTGCFGVVMTSFVHIVFRIFVASLLTLEGSNGCNTLF